jgi:cation:H+ antiporter
MTILYLILIFFACAILVKSADLVIRNLARISEIFHWGTFVASFILVAVATSLPEIFVALTSGLQKISNLSLGNIIGANILNLTLILGLPALIGRGLNFKEIKIQNVLFALVLSLYPFFLALDKFISRLDGFAILFVYLFYILFMIRQEQKFKITNIYNHYSKKELFRAFFYFILGLILLISSAQIVVYSAKVLANNLNLSLIIIGFLIVSLGTTLPELTFGLRAVLKGHQEMSLGNSLGSIVTNSCFALGLAAVIQPIKIFNFHQFIFLFCFLVITIILSGFFIYSQRKLSIGEAISLIIFYLIFVIIQFLCKF